MRINNTHSVLQILLSKTDLLNVANDNNISATENTIEKLISTLEQDSQAAIIWIKTCLS